MTDRRETLLAELKAKYEEIDRQAGMAAVGGRDITSVVDDPSHTIYYLAGGARIPVVKSRVRKVIDKISTEVLEIANSSDTGLNILGKAAASYHMSPTLMETLTVDLLSYAMPKDNDSLVTSFVAILDTREVIGVPRLSDHPEGTSLHLKIKDTLYVAFRLREQEIAKWGITRERPWLLMDISSLISDYPGRGDEIANLVTTDSESPIAGCDLKRLRERLDCNSPSLSLGIL